MFWIWLNKICLFFGKTWNSQKFFFLFFFCMNNFCMNIFYYYFFFYFSFLWTKSIRKIHNKKNLFYNKLHPKKFSLPEILKEIGKENLEDQEVFRECFFTKFETLCCKIKFLLSNKKTLYKLNINKFQRKSAVPPCVVGTSNPLLNRLWLTSTWTCTSRMKSLTRIYRSA